MKKLDAYFFDPKPIEDILATADVVVDSSVLLSLYQWKELTYNEVMGTIKDFSARGQLKIPSHVIEEFVYKRPQVISNITKKINEEISSKTNVAKTKLKSVAPLIEIVEGYGDFEKLEEEYLTIHKNYKKSLELYSKKINNLLFDDLVFNQLKPILSENYIEQDFNEEELNREALSRAQKRVPPLTGGDKHKKENAYGDYYIWKQILGLDNDVIFVTLDFKEDWWYKDYQDNKIAPRRELIEEFYTVSEGKTCAIVSFADFIELVKKDVQEEVLKDLKQSELNINNIKSNSLLDLNVIYNQTFEIEYEADELYYSIEQFIHVIYDVLFEYKVLSVKHSGEYLRSMGDSRFLYLDVITESRLRLSDFLNKLKQQNFDHIALRTIVEVDEKRRKEVFPT